MHFESILVRHSSHPDPVKDQSYKLYNVVTSFLYDWQLSSLSSATIVRSSTKMMLLVVFVVHVWEIAIVARSKRAKETRMEVCKQRTRNSRRSSDKKRKKKTTQTYRAMKADDRRVYFFAWCSSRRSIPAVVDKKATTAVSFSDWSRYGSLPTTQLFAAVSNSPARFWRLSMQMMESKRAGQRLFHNCCVAFCTRPWQSPVKSSQQARTSHCWINWPVPKWRTNRYRYHSPRGLSCLPACLPACLYLPLWGGSCATSILPISVATERLTEGRNREWTSLRTDPRQKVVCQPSPSSSRPKSEKQIQVRFLCTTDSLRFSGSLDRWTVLEARDPAPSNTSGVSFRSVVPGVTLYMRSYYSGPPLIVGEVASDATSLASPICSSSNLSWAFLCRR